MTIKRSIGPLIARAPSKARAKTLPIGYIALDCSAAEFVGDRLKGLEPTTKQRELRTRRIEMLRGSGADSGASAGDQRMTSIERSPHRFVLAERQ